MPVWMRRQVCLHWKQATRTDRQRIRPLRCRSNRARHRQYWLAELCGENESIGSASNDDLLPCGVRTILRSLEYTDIRVRSRCLAGSPAEKRVRSVYGRLRSNVTAYWDLKEGENRPRYQVYDLSSKEFTKGRHVVSGVRSGLRLHKVPT